MNQRRGNTAPAEAARFNHPLLGCDLKKVTSINKASFATPVLLYVPRAAEIRSRGSQLLMLRPELVTTGFACAGDELGNGGRQGWGVPQGKRQRWYRREGGKGGGYRRLFSPSAASNKTPKVPQGVLPHRCKQANPEAKPDRRCRLPGWALLGTVLYLRHNYISRHLIKFYLNGGKSVLIPSKCHPPTIASVPSLGKDTVAQHAASSHPWYSDS